MNRTRSNSDPEKVLAFTIECARTCSDMKCSDVRVLDVRGLSQVSDYIVVASGTSGRQMKSVAQALEDIGKEGGDPPFRTNRDSSGTWVVVDFVDTVVHLFEPEQRFYYDIETLWKTGARIDWARPGDPATDTSTDASTGSSAEASAVDEG